MRRSSLTFGICLTPVLIPYVAHSATFLDEQQAVSAIFPASEKMIKKQIFLNDEEIKKIEKASGETVRNKTLNCLVNSKKEIVFIDQVLGKHEFITYATGITKDATIKAIEIMEYRETYGQQVRNESWRKQFIGKTKKAPLKLKEDIVNISGATLSSSHIAAGVRRLLQTYEIIRSRL